MRLDRRTFLLLALVGAACSKEVEPSTSAGRAAAYLWSQQAEDGGFQSTTYGLLRSGQSLTPFVLNTLLDVPESVVHRPEYGVERALEFIRRHTSPEGILGYEEGATLDYPNYATALAIQVFVKAKPNGWQDDIAPMMAGLRQHQFSEQNGWTEADAAYGGWGMGGPIQRPPGAGHVDLSMTRYVLEALRHAGVPASDPAIQRALVYLGRSQNPDGGFFFSLVNPETNKAGRAEGAFASYGTATADGLLALRAAGVPESDARILGAVQWLRDHHTSDRAPGFDSARESWGSGLRFYYAGVISEAVPGLPVSLPGQHADGSYTNSNTMVKEDDPLIATSFAVRALLTNGSS